MAFVVFVIDCPNNSITDLNNRTQDPGNLNNPLNKCANVLAAIAGGKISASVQVTTRDTDPSVATSGTGSTQQTYNHK